MVNSTLLIVCLVMTFIVSMITSVIVATIVSKKKSYRKINKILKETKEIKSVKELTEMTTRIINDNDKQHQQIMGQVNDIIIEKVNNIKNIASIRYDSTPDSGGKMSFSMALLNEKSSGIILTNIYMREGSFLYLREIDHGKCEIEISEEEKQVLQQAIKNDNICYL